MNNFEQNTNELIQKSASNKEVFQRNCDEVDLVSEQFALDPVFKKHYTEAIEAALDTTYKEVRSLLWRPDDIATSLRRILLGLPPNEIDFTPEAVRKVLDDLLKIKEDFDLEVTKSRNLIYSSVRDVNDLCIEAGEDKNISCNLFHIDSTTVDGMICFKLPYLPQKLSAGNHTGERFKNSWLYSHELRCLALKELDQLIPNVTDYRTKTISYFFIKGTKKGEPLDADNHDTKRITDAILNLFPGADAPWSCSFWYEELEPKTQIAEDITIIIVKKGKRSPATPEDFEKVIASFFHQTGSKMG